MQLWPQILPVFQMNCVLHTNCKNGRAVGRDAPSALHHFIHTLATWASMDTKGGGGGGGFEREPGWLGNDDGDREPCWLLA